MDDTIVVIYCLCDDLLQALDHRDDPQSKMSDAEVMTTALVAARFFGGNQEHARALLGSPRYVPHMLSKSRFCRRLHALAPLFEVLFAQLAEEGAQHRLQLHHRHLSHCRDGQYPHSTWPSHESGSSLAC
jgi:hypothetical protein